MRSGSRRTAWNPLGVLRYCVLTHFRTFPTGHADSGDVYSLESGMWYRTGNVPR